MAATLDMHIIPYEYIHKDMYIGRHALMYMCMHI